MEPIVRPLFAYGLNQKGLYHCEVRSSQTNTIYRLYVRPFDGRCWCECPCFQYRYATRQPSIYSGEVCKHIRAYREFLQKELHDLNQLTP